MAAVQQANLRNTRGSQNRFDDDDLCFMVNALLYSRIFEIVQKKYKYFQTLLSRVLVHLFVDITS
jgi:hypothetical protein